MKHFLIPVIFILAAVFVSAQNMDAFIQELSGTVELKTQDQANWRPARAQDRLEKSTIISTGFKSTALVSVGSSILMVRPLTRLSLESLLADQNVETINIGLRTGRIQVNVNPSSGSRTSLTVQTPVATASVRGTVFFLDPVNLQVLEGTVRYEASGEKSAYRPVLVNAGQSSWVDIDAGRAMNPLVFAESSRELPPLPGQSSVPGVEKSARLKSSLGYVEFDLTLDKD